MNIQKLLTTLLLFSIFTTQTSFLALRAEDRVVKITEIKAQKIKTENERYVRLKDSDYQLLKRQALLGTSIVQRIRDLERVYRQVKNIIETINATINLVKKVLNIDDADIPLIGSISNDNEFEHISGVIMSPGYVEFTATVTDSELVFDDLNYKNLEFDLYYNKNLFTIDHIEGKGVFGDEYKRISLPQRTKAAKDRIKLPLSDVLLKQVSFKVFLAPLDHETIEVGDKTKMNIRFYKRVAKNEGGERIPPVSYQLAESSPDEIEVTVK